MTNKALLALVALAGVSVGSGCSFESADESPGGSSGGIFTDRSFDPGAPLEVRSASDDAESTADAPADVPAAEVPEDAPAAEVPEAIPAAAPPEDEPVADDELVEDDGPLTDPHLLHVASTVVQAEFDQASVALTRAKVSEVKSFAGDVLRAHGEAYPPLDLIQRVGLSKNALSRELFETAAATLASLNSAADVEFDALYVDAQVQAGEEVLELIDVELTPRAESAQVREYLRTFRARIEKQLSAAKALVEPQL